jgi:hypothetical protein
VSCKEVSKAARQLDVDLGALTAAREQKRPVAYQWGLGVQTPPKLQSFDKAEPNSQFRGKYIRNNVIRIRVSLTCKLREPLTRGKRAQIPVLSPLYPKLNLLNPPKKKNPGYATEKDCGCMWKETEEKYTVGSGRVCTALQVVLGGQTR